VQQNTAVWTVHLDGRLPAVIAGAALHVAVAVGAMADPARQLEHANARHLHVLASRAAGQPGRHRELRQHLAE